MQKRLISFLAAVVIVLGLSGFSAGRLRDPAPPVSEKNAENFAALLSDLVKAYETPEDTDAETIEASLRKIESADRDDLAMANVIAERWKALYLDPDLRLYLFSGGETAEGMEDSGIPDGGKHAIVILGYALLDGEMQPELIGRCDAAAALARTYPSAVLVCSGGATGENNPEKHTEAGLMRDYLTGQCGIEPGRILTDEKASNTAENAVNTLEILRENAIHTMTIVTSSYHQRRGQLLYAVMAERYRGQHGYEVRIVGNYCYDIESSSPTQAYDDRIAVMQIAGMLELPQEIIRTLPSIPRNVPVPTGDPADVPAPTENPADAAA